MTEPAPRDEWAMMESERFLLGRLLTRANAALAGDDTVVGLRRQVAYVLERLNDIPIRVLRRPTAPPPDVTQPGEVQR